MEEHEEVSDSSSGARKVDCSVVLVHAHIHSFFTSTVVSLVLCPNMVRHQQAVQHY